MSLSKKLRFEVFKRDGFVCGYCGAHPPDVILEVDHITAVAAGGGDDEDNLITACFNCNRGKSDRDLNVAPMPLDQKAALVAEREEQLLGYQEIMQARRDRLEGEAWRVAEALAGKAVNKYDAQRLLSFKRFLEKLGLPEVLDCAEIARARKPTPQYSEYTQFRYFCGVCWNKIKGE